MLQKWNYNTHEYEPFDSPAKVTTLYSENMSTEIDCANCGKSMIFGDGYTSQTIHNDFGLGFPVCEPCYEKESEDRKNDIHS